MASVSLTQSQTQLEEHLVILERISENWSSRIGDRALMDKHITSLEAVEKLINTKMIKDKGQTNNGNRYVSFIHRIKLLQLFWDSHTKNAPQDAKKTDGVQKSTSANAKSTEMLFTMEGKLKIDALIQRIRAQLNSKTSAAIEPVKPVATPSSSLQTKIQSNASLQKEAAVPITPPPPKQPVKKEEAEKQFQNLKKDVKITFVEPSPSIVNLIKEEMSIKIKYHEELSKKRGCSCYELLIKGMKVKHVEQRNAKAFFVFTSTKMTFEMEGKDFIKITEVNPSLSKPRPLYVEISKVIHKVAYAIYTYFPKSSSRQEAITIIKKIPTKFKARAAAYNRHGIAWIGYEETNKKIALFWAPPDQIEAIPVEADGRNYQTGAYATSKNCQVSFFFDGLNPEKPSCSINEEEAINLPV